MPRATALYTLLHSGINRLRSQRKINFFSLGIPLIIFQLSLRVSRALLAQTDYIHLLRNTLAVSYFCLLNHEPSHLLKAYAPQRGTYFYIKPMIYSFNSQLKELAFSPRISLAKELCTKYAWWKVFCETLGFPHKNEPKI